jgi:hypothetical protein
MLIRRSSVDLEASTRCQKGVTTSQYRYHRRDREAKENMQVKYLVAFVLSSLVVGCFLLPGCGSSTTKSTVKQQTVPVTKSSSSSQFSSQTGSLAVQGKVGDAMQVGDLTVKVISAGTLDSMTDWQPDKAGDKAYRADVEVTDNGNKPIEVWPSDWKLRTSEGHSYDFTDGSYNEVTPEFSNTTIDPGQKIRGYVYTEVPPDVKASEIDFDNNDAGRARMTL